MDKTVYWLWLQGVIGFAKDVRELVAHFGSAEEIYKADKDTLKSSGVKILTSYLVKKMLSESLDKYLEVIEFCKKHKIHIITPDSEYYPERLLEIENYPLVLYVRGDYTCLKAEHIIGVIGSRTPSKYGEDAAREIVGELCKNGFLIVSGGALGIDTIAHKSAVESGSKTILVMGCGHGTDYLSQNSLLRKEVSKNGALITEYPPLTPVTRFSFPHRNRIISAMSKGVVIVEAAEYSGTFSTANYVRKHGRELFVLPGDINSGNFAGSNRLISEGATPVFSGEEVVSAYFEKVKPKKKAGLKTGMPFPNIDVEASSTKKKSRSKPKRDAETKEDKTPEKENTENIVKINLESISKNAQIVYNIMSDGVCELDELVRASSLEVRKVLVSLTELEMYGAVSLDGPNKYRLNK